MYKEIYTTIKVNGKDYEITIIYNPNFADCYSIYIENIDDEIYECLTMSENPSHPQGVFSSRENLRSPENLSEGEKFINYDDLPEACKKSLAGWLKE